MGEDNSIDNRAGDTTMFMSMKIALAAALVAGTASVALADDAQGTRAELLALIQNRAADAHSSFSYATSPIHQANVTHKRDHNR
jgi:hypothetical protein